MAKGTAGKNYWALLLMILAGVVLGGFIGQLSAGVPLCKNQRGILLHILHFPVILVKKIVYPIKSAHRFTKKGSRF